MQIVHNRRRFLTGLSALAAAGLANSRNAAAEAPAETATARFSDAPGICVSPQYVAEELIRAEGFSDFGYVAVAPGLAATEMVARGEIDFSVDFATAFVIPIDASRDLFKRRDQIRDSVRVLGAALVVQEPGLLRRGFQSRPC